jgi:hypothetical protein
MDQTPIPILQLPLFNYGESVTNVVELFPAVWQATENLTAPDPTARQHGLDILLELGAQKVSNLVAYMIATCLNDPDISIRQQVAIVLADLLVIDKSGNQAPDEVRKVVVNYLHNTNEAMVYGLLEAVLGNEQVEKSIYHIFNACPYIGRYLGDILNQWKNPLPIRQKAIYYVGLVGYLEALTIMERLFNRLEARQNGQYLMSFAPPSSKTDDELLPYLRVAIDRLRAR